MIQVENRESGRETGLARERTTWAERWQSLKAGGLGAIAAACVFGGLLQLNRVAIQHLPALTGIVTGQDGMTVLVDGAIAVFSGFLFAVTYRYIVRQNHNPHLRSGAVGAFGLVRGLALVELAWPQGQPLVLALFVMESFLLFGGIRFLLDWALTRHWIQPFQAS